MIVKIGFGSGFKRVGFDVDANTPKLSANFTTSTYKSNGAAKTFVDLFTFTRAGKAWLVKDTGLQEYAIDVPRFDNGLLIEQSATNFIRESSQFLVSPESNWRLFSVTSSGTGSNNIKTAAANAYHRVYNSSVSVPQFNHTRSQSLLIGDIQTRYIAFSPSDGLASNGGVAIDTTDLSFVYSESENQVIDNASIKVRRIGSLILITYIVNDMGAWSNSGTAIISFQFLSRKELSALGRYFTANGTESFTVLVADAKVENQASTPIITTTAPVTRPADYLLNKITGTTVTGDWDSTLTLSIVAGNLVHSGYGRIRSLEIN